MINFLFYVAGCRISQFGTVLSDVTCTAIVLDMTTSTIYSPKILRSKIE